MQPSDPTPEEREIRQGLECCLSWLPTDESERLDAYARAVYQRGVRDGLTKLAAESEDGTYVFGSEEILRFRDALRTLTPPEPTE